MADRVPAQLDIWRFPAAERRGGRWQAAVDPEVVQRRYCPAVGSSLSWQSRLRYSIASDGSILSIGSMGSVCSVGSVGSAASALSVGSAASFGSVLSFASRGSLLSARSAGAIRGIQGTGPRRTVAGLTLIAAGAVMLAAGRSR